jgi:hypothetical protein
MKYVKTYESFTINEEFFGIKAKLKEGMEAMKKMMEKDPEIKQQLEENFKNLSEEQKEELRKPGLLQRIKNFFNTDDAAALFGSTAKNKHMVSESSESDSDKVFMTLGRFIGLSGIVSFLGGMATVISSIFLENGFIGACGAAAFLLGFVVSCAMAGSMED